MWQKLVMWLTRIPCTKPLLTTVCLPIVVAIILRAWNAFRIVNKRCPRARVSGLVPDTALRCIDGAGLAHIVLVQTTLAPFKDELPFLTLGAFSACSLLVDLWDTLPGEKGLLRDAIFFRDAGGAGGTKVSARWTKHNSKKEAERGGMELLLFYCMCKV